MANKLLGKAKSSQVSTEQIKEIGQLKQREIKFRTDEATITSDSQQELNKLGQDIEQFNPESVTIHIIGHTSRVGKADKNQRLSLARAQAVANYLRTQTQAKHNIVVEGKGFDEPIPNLQPNDPRNQRTEIRLERKP